MYSIAFPKLFCSGQKSLSSPDVASYSDQYSMKLRISESILGGRMKHPNIFDGNFCKDKIGCKTFSEKPRNFKEKDSFFMSIRPVLYLAQVFAILPVSGLSSK